MKLNRVSLVVTAVAALLGASGVLLIATAPRTQVSEAAIDASVEDYLHVAGLRLGATPTRDRIEVPGVIQPIRRVALAAEVSGRLSAVGAAEHSVVAAGQMILQLDQALPQAAVDRSQAAVLRTRSTHRLAELDLERQRSLFDRGVSSQAELDRAVSQERATLGALREAEATLVEAEELLAKSTIRAPFDGVLTNFDLEVGDRVDVGSPIGEVLDLGQVEIEIGVTDREIVALQPGDAATFEIGAFPNRVFAGRVRAIGSALDATTRKFPVEVVADNPEGVLLPGMVARVACEIGDERAVLRLPRQATTEEFGLSYVFVLVPEDDHLVVRRRRVALRPVAFRPAEVEVAGGLEAGEWIVAANLRDVSDGLRVVLEEPR
jgi:RND family efflux transporter MFP subunit